jgi:hypothetical protein
MSRGQFKCKHCGDRFNLSPDDQELYNEGWFDHEPDICEECADMLNHPSFDSAIDHSDADPGL